MIDWILSVYHAHTNSLLLYAYGLPALVNTVVFVKRSIKEYAKDVKEHQDKYYSPSITLGLLVSRLLGIITPIVNSVVFVFNTLPSFFKLIGEVAAWLTKVLDIPLVPHRPKDKE